MGLTESKLEKDLSDNFFPPSERYFGFENYGNTCYCNSVLQALYFAVPFRNAILNHHKKNPPSGESLTLLDALGNLFEEVSSQKAKTGSLGPRQFILTLKKENVLFKSSQQQDAQEFLNYLMNNLSETLDKTEGADNNFIKKLFQGRVENETKCLTCESNTIVKETFFDLSLDISQNVSLLHCLSSFCRTETMTGGEKFFCDFCFSKQEGRRTSGIAEYPTLLICHLKRFKYFERLERFVKLFYRVVFPFHMKLKNDTFNLYAIVIHIGTYLLKRNRFFPKKTRGPLFGHYISMIKSGEKWLLFDDENISIISETEIPLCFGSTNEMTQRIHKTDCSYLLFYQKE